jgi:hypothetical protein
MSSEHADIPLPGIIEMGEGESAWVRWHNGSDADTGGYCNCGHEGLGPGWHTTDCRGANRALTHKARELFIAVDTQWQWAHAVQCQAKLIENKCELSQGCLWPKPA